MLFGIIALIGIIYCAFLVYKKHDNPDDAHIWYDSWSN